MHFTAEFKFKFKINVKQICFQLLHWELWEHIFLLWTEGYLVSARLVEAEKLPGHSKMPCLWTTLNKNRKLALALVGLENFWTTDQFSMDFYLIWAALCNKYWIWNTDILLTMNFVKHLAKKMNPIMITATHQLKNWHIYINISRWKSVQIIISLTWQLSMGSVSLCVEIKYMKVNQKYYLNLQNFASLLELVYCIRDFTTHHVAFTLCQNGNGRFCSLHPELKNCPKCLQLVK